MYHTMLHTSSLHQNNMVRGPHAGYRAILVYILLLLLMALRSARRRGLRARAGVQLTLDRRLDVADDGISADTVDQQYDAAR